MFKRERLSSHLNRPTPTLLLIILGAFALRLAHLGADSLWYDETVSVFLAGQPVPALIAHTARDIHPPGYYLLLRGWLLLANYPTGQAAGADQGLEFVAGFLSLWWGVLLTPLAWALARRLRLGERAALLAALLVAASPFGVWYSQEVRMYTLGASLGVVCLLATATFLAGGSSAPRRARAMALYALAAAAGLYTLYYFAFLLVALNLALLPVLLRRWHRERARGKSVAEHEGRPGLLAWLLAQLAALLLYLPWLPVALRQATDPPVPPWRTPAPLNDVLQESWTALSFGQSAQGPLWRPLLLLTLSLVALALVAGTRSQQGAGPGASSRPARWLLLAALLGPLALILLASLAVPLYHVRYLFTYAPAFSLLLAAGLAAVEGWRPPLGRWLLAAALALLLVGSGLSLQRFWADPAYRADDHRAAVHELAQRWRPGDPILVNAGYAYPTLLTYWPLPVAWQGRLSQFGPQEAALLADARGAVILQTGHVDGDPTLGWGDPRSDFYALPAEALTERLAGLAGAANRLWHYRIYDTVNDPQGLARRALQADWTLFDERLYSGEASLRVQGFLSRQHRLYGPAIAQFGGWLNLHALLDELPLVTQAGGPLDLPYVGWSRAEGAAARPAAFSLRLVDEAGQVWAQQDEPIGGNVADLGLLDSLPQPLRLPTSPGAPPLDYRLQLLVYDRQTGRPLPITAGPFSGLEAVSLGRAVVERPEQQPGSLPALADFGALRLIEAETPATILSPGDSAPLALLWQAAPGFDGQELVVVVQLLDAAGRVAASLEEQPLAGRYPTAAWRPGELVRDRHRLILPSNAPAGRYRLIVGLYRAADRGRLEARTGLWGLARRDHVVVKEIELR